MVLDVLLEGVVDVLPLAATAFVGHNAAGADAVRRRFQQLVEFAVGIGGLDMDEAGLDAIAHHRLGHKYDPVFPTANPGSIMVEIGNGDFQERTLLPVRAIRFYKGMLRFHSTFLIGPQVAKIQDDIELPLSNHRLNYECS